MKKIDFCIGIFDNLSENSLNKLKKDIDNCEIFGIGVYTEKVIIQEFFTKPVKKLEERLDAVKKIDGVDFVFPIQLGECIDEIAENAYNEYLVRIKAATSKKEEFKAGIVIGSYDLLHAGHIENMNFVKGYMLL